MPAVQQRHEPRPLQSVWWNIHHSDDGHQRHEHQRIHHHRIIPGHGIRGANTMDVARWQEIKDADGNLDLEAFFEPFPGPRLLRTQRRWDDVRDLPIQPQCKTWGDVSAWQDEQATNWYQ